MTKSATDVMQQIVFSAVLDAIAALKASSKGLPNNLLRELNAIHANTTMADLPKELQAAIDASVRAAFTRLLKEGYSVSSGQPPAAPASRPVGAGRGPGTAPRGPRPPRPSGPRGDGPDRRRTPPSGPRGGGKGGPRSR